MSDVNPSAGTSTRLDGSEPSACDSGGRRTYDPRGYGPLTRIVQCGPHAMQDHLPQRLCLRCGAVVADPALHERWHGAMDL